MADVTTLLCVLPEVEHDRLVPLVAEGPALYERLTGERPSKQLLCRHATAGVYGVRLQTVSRGRRRMTCARWVVEHWAAVDAARQGVRS